MWGSILPHREIQETEIGEITIKARIMNAYNEMEKTCLLNWVNRNFLIRYASKDDPKQTKLIGALGYRGLVGFTLADKHFRRLKNSKSQVVTIKLRRGLRIDFVSK